MVFETKGYKIRKDLKLLNMSYDKVKEALKKQVIEKKIKKKDATKALRSIKTEEKQNERRTS